MLTVDVSELMAQHSNYGGSLSYRQIAQKYGTTPEIVRKRIQRYRLNRVDQESTVLTTSPKVENKIDDDLTKWEFALKRLPKLTRYAHVTDLHVPDHDPRAVDLAAKIIADFNPHILLHGSDAFDFETISRFGTSVEKLIEDALWDIQVPYSKVMSTLNQASPRAIRPFLIGNHDKRIITFMQQNAPQFRGTVTKVFADMIRHSDGLWLGFEREQLEIGPLTIYHGRTATQNAAKMHAEKYVAFQRDVIAGHVHRAQLFSKTGPERTIESVTSGCLCNLKPSYSNYRQDWQHGIVLVTIDFENQQSHFEVINFKKNQAVFGGKVYRA